MQVFQARSKLLYLESRLLNNRYNSSSEAAQVCSTVK